MTIMTDDNSFTIRASSVQVEPISAGCWGVGSRHTGERLATWAPKPDGDSKTTYSTRSSMN
jgi:hypothetical protein